ncbi:hypothetical protein [Campylobacter curvus]|uniref:hypothetical protein n=1 Tax=Campylobacter curvus TaxID=200 RepID=UPI0014703F7D|nr:hypothetical protein [Campylobacter curvus]
MARYAFLDVGRKNLVYAKDLFDKDREYYCLSKDCDARLYLCSQNGIKHAYFRAKFKKFPHKEDCFYKNSQDFDTDNFDEKSFKFENLIDLFMRFDLRNMNNNISYTNKTNDENNSAKTQNKISTIRNLYIM